VMTEKCNLNITEIKIWIVKNVSDICKNGVFAKFVAVLPFFGYEELSEKTYF